jgi:hypothetical protein
MGQEHRTFRMRGEGKRMEMNLHGTNAPLRRHLLKERLIMMWPESGPSKFLKITKEGKTDKRRGPPLGLLSLNPISTSNSDPFSEEAQELSEARAESRSQFKHQDVCIEEGDV